MLDAGAQLEADLRPVTWPDVELVAGGGNYLRSGGTWRYAATRRPVPGAIDITLGRRYAGAPRVTRDDGEHVLLDPSWLDGPGARPELRWCAPYGDGAAGPAAQGGAAGPEAATLAAVAAVAAPAVAAPTAVAPATVAVPAAEFDARAAVVVGLWAPELDPAELLTASAIARLLGVSRSTVNAYHSRGQMPPPVAVLSNRLPLWTRPIVDHWAARQTRRRRAL